MNHYMVLDLETVPDPSVPEEPAEGARDRCPAAPHHQIVAGAIITLSFRGFDVDVRGPRLLGPDGTELSIVDDAVALLAKRPILTGWNIRGFDLPVLTARAMRYGIRAPWLWSRDIQDRYRGDLCLDLQDAVNLNGAGRSARMGAFAQNIGWPGKTDCTGADVAALWAAGERQRVEKYVLADVVQEAAILTRLLYCRGEITAETHNAAAEQLYAAVCARPEFEAWRGRIDERLSRVTPPAAVAGAA